MIILIRAFKLDEQKGGLPVASSKRMHPSDQKSDAKDRTPLSSNNSGAI